MIEAVIWVFLKSESPIIRRVTMRNPSFIAANQRYSSIMAYHMIAIYCRIDFYWRMILMRTCLDMRFYMNGSVSVCLQCIPFLKFRLLFDFNYFLWTLQHSLHFSELKNSNALSAVRTPLKSVKSDIQIESNRFFTSPLSSHSSRHFAWKRWLQNGVSLTIDSAVNSSKQTTQLLCSS